MLAAADSVAVPLTMSVAPAAGVKLPLPSASVSASVPLLTCTEPEFAHGMVIVLVPVAAVLRSVPAFARSGEPLLIVNELPSAWRSKVAAGALLNTPPLQVIWPPVHAPALALTNVPPLSVLLAPLRVIVPLARSVSGEPKLPKLPELQINNPATMTVLLPVSVPPFSVTFVG